MYVKRGVCVFRGDEYHHRLHDYVPDPQPIKYDSWLELKENLEGVYFEGYPQILKQKGSEPKYTMKVEKNVMVPMHDGVRLAVDIYRPDAEGKFPTILSFGSWGKDICEMVLWMPPQQYLPDTPLWAGNLEAGPIPYFVERGYVVVVPDPRGWKLSEGDIDVFIDTMFKDWPSDIYDLIEWITKQPWCDGKVGMIGECIYGAAQILAAALKPHPALKAIAPWEYVGVLVSDVNFNGALHTMLYSILTNRHVNDSNAWPKCKLIPWAFKHLSKEEVEKRIKELLEHPDIRYNPRYYGVLTYPEMDPAGFMVDGLLQWLHPIPKDEFPYENITIPTYLNTPWLVAIYIWDTFYAFEKIGSKNKKLLVSLPREMPRPWIDYADELVRWFDYWLKGIDTGVMDEPPVTLFMTGINKWRFEREWPPKRVRFTKLYLHPKGYVSFDKPSGQPSQESFTQPALYENPAVYAMFYTSNPLKENLEVIGPIELHLEASIDKDFTNWIVDLVNVAPSGEANVLSTGYLCTYFRTLDEKKSKVGFPVYKREDHKPTPQGLRIEYRIAMMPVAHLFQRGDRIQVIIRNQDDLLSKDGLVRDYILPRMETVTHTIYYGNSYIELPIIPKPKSRIIVAPTA